MVPTARRVAVVEWLERIGFQQRAARKAPDKAPFARALRFEKGDVTVDTLVGSVRDREAKVDIPEPWIAARARRVKLDLLTGRVDTPVRVARPEAVWALKLQSGRIQDLTDLFAIDKEPVDGSEVTALFESLMCPTLREKLNAVLNRLSDPRVYADARSLRALRDTATTRRRWDVFRGKVAGILNFES